MWEAAFGNPDGSMMHLEGFVEICAGLPIVRLDERVFSISATDPMRSSAGMRCRVAERDMGVPTPGYGAQEAMDSLRSWGG